MDPLEDLKKMKDSLSSDTIPGLQKMMNQVKSNMEMMNPIESKSIPINGTSCTMQLFKDKVAILFPSQKMASEYYKELFEWERQLDKLGSDLQAEQIRYRVDMDKYSKRNVDLAEEMKVLKEESERIKNKWYCKLFSKW